MTRSLGSELLEDEILETNLYVSKYRYRSIPRYGQSPIHKSESRCLGSWSITITLSQYLIHHRHLQKKISSLLVYLSSSSTDLSSFFSCPITLLLITWFLMTSRELSTPFSRTLVYLDQLSVSSDIQIVLVPVFKTYRYSIVLQFENQLVQYTVLNVHAQNSDFLYTPLLVNVSFLNITVTTCRDTVHLLKPRSPQICIYMCHMIF